MGSPFALELKGITKTFGSTIANKDVDLQVKNGEILSILGENGSGKTTLMNMVSGIYYPDSGEIYVGGKEVVIKSPKDAFDLKIGMIHQHFKLVDVFNAVQNIVLGVKDGNKYNLKEAEKRVKAICDKYGFVIDFDKKIYEMSVSEKQTVEIIKVLYRGADILILDEPTTGLDPQTRLLIWNVIEKLRINEKMTVFLTTHYMEEAANASYVVILDKGRIVAEGTPLELKNEYVRDTISLYGVTEDEVKSLGNEYRKIRDGYSIQVKNTLEATRLIVEHQEIFRDYEVTKGGMDDVFLAVTGKMLGGGQ